MYRHIENFLTFIQKVSSLNYFRVISLAKYTSSASHTNMYLEIHRKDSSSRHNYAATDSKKHQQEVHEVLNTLMPNLAKCLIEDKQMRDLFSILTGLRI